MIRTIKDMLGMNPMSDVFTTTPDLTPYSAVLPGSLCEPPVNPELIPECGNATVQRTPEVRSLHDGNWWAKATHNFNFKQPDALNSAEFNRVLWHGIMGDKPYPVRPSQENDD
jgi:DNA-binding beta-propeller fold protein YncE